MKIGVMYSGIDGLNGADYMSDYLLTAFQTLGHDVTPIGERFGYELNHGHVSEAKQQDFVTHMTGYNLTPAIVKEIQRTTSMVLWTQNDEMRNKPNWYALAKSLTYTVDFHYCYTMDHDYGSHVIYMPIAADTTKFYRTSSDGEYHEDDRWLDVVLIGCGHRWRRAFTERLKTYYPQNSLFDFTMGMPFEDINTVYNQAKIAICPYQDCDQGLPGRAWGCPCRTFEVPASGCFQLHVERGGLKDVYPDAITLPQIDNPVDAADAWANKLQELLDNPLLREEQANKERLHTLANHSYTNRAQTIIDNFVEAKNFKHALKRA